MIYRNEIDGLRAVAVLPVIFYHSNISIFSGGFIGVDIFFVISGFLISNILYKEIEAGSFSIISFYERRVRRIIPALFIVTAISIPLAWYTLAPQYFKNFSQSIVATQIFSSNILFWITGNYFDTSSELKPLLHTWSLSVEEQFYVFYPLVIFYSLKVGKHFTQIILGILLFMSLYASEYYLRTSPNTSFYLLHTRAWELLLGCICSSYLLNYAKFHTFKLSNALSFFGFVLIIASLFYFDHSTPTPGFFTLAPTLGAGLVLLFAKPNTYCHNVLSNSILKWIGLMSYSLYLWHQPILAIARHTTIREIDNLTLSILLILILFLSYLTWKFVERPFRNNIIFTRKQVFTYFSVTSILFVFFGLIGHFTNGFISRATPSHLPINYFNFYNRDHVISSGIDGKLCISETNSLCIVNSTSNVNSRNILLVGDSHSGDYSSKFKEFVTDNNFNASQMTIPGCGFIQSQFARHNGYCGKSFDRLKEYVLLNHIDDVIFITSMYDHVIADKDLLSNLDLLNYLSKHSTRLWIFKPRLSLSSDPLRAANLNLLDQLIPDAPKLRLDIDEMLTKLESSHKNIFIFDEMQSLYKISDKPPISFNAHTSNNTPLYIDTNHLNSYSANLIFVDFVDFYNQKIKQSTP